LFNKLTTVENKKNNLSEALNKSKVEISRSLNKLKSFKKWANNTTHTNSSNNMLVTSFFKGITFVKDKLEKVIMLSYKSNNVQTRKLKGKFIPTCK